MKGNWLYCIVIFTVLVSVTSSAIPYPSRFLPYLLYNTWESGLPRSYNATPAYFEQVPENERPHFYEQGEVEPQCNNIFVPADKMNAYQFQTEEILSIAGLNLYDGAMWQTATTLLGYIGVAEQYQQTTLIEHRTLQFPNIKANAPCKGVIQYNQCQDSNEDGGCGFCYGDDPNKTLDLEHAYFFRMVSDVWRFDGAGDVRCPTLNGVPNYWTWNDYRPVTGENAWSYLIAPLQTAYFKASQKVDNIPDNSPAFTLALDFIPALEKMLVENHGAIYYTPRNTWDVSNPKIGDSVSTENNASVLAGLKMLLYILTTRSSKTYAMWIPRVQSLVGHVTNYLRNSYNFQYKYFSQGANYSAQTGTWTWVQEPYFAVDCQTWVITVLGRDLIDSWFGEGTSMTIWNITKSTGGYKYSPSSTWAEGVGFTQNSAQVFSGEWSLGAINMLKVLANTYSGSTKQALLDEAAYMREALESQLVTAGTVRNGISGTGVLYANKRYFIPFGWYANPLWSTASVAWTVTTDLNFNPFYLGGDLKSTY